MPPIPRARSTPADRSESVTRPISIRSDSIKLILEGSTDTLAVAVSSLRRVEQGIGRRSFAHRGRNPALIIGGIGAALGLVAGSYQDSDAVSVPGGLLVGAATGALIGFVTGGAMADGNVWEEMPSGHSAR